MLVGLQRYSFHLPSLVEVLTKYNTLHTIFRRVTRSITHNFIPLQTTLLLPLPSLGPRLLSTALLYAWPWSCPTLPRPQR